MMHTGLPMVDVRRFGPVCGPVENFKLGPRLNSS
jgi:hypothetical protein